MNPLKKHKQFYYNRMQLTANIRSYVRNPGIRCQLIRWNAAVRAAVRAVPVTAFALNIRPVNCCKPNPSKKHWAEDAGPVGCDAVSLGEGFPTFRRAEGLDGSPTMT